ncbi:thioredoxin family protein [Poseidonocella sp. HB161398]|uniref:thioredoxin family protein n=1 Tax=Poseidonocella sp. HB161398 TaxID=2320855 RepID=UPI0011083CAF|nr:thioredoxin family protein [Poseidonocella sp. HB161398]
MAVETPVCDFGWRPPPFALPATDGRRYRLGDIAGERGTLVMFICNHCPYVLAVLDRILRDARDLERLGIGVAAICANDAASHPADSFPEMAKLAARRGFPFPYLHDAAQSVARGWGAACTPDFFGFDAGLGLQYRGRLDASRKEAAPEGTRRDLYEAMARIAETGRGPAEQIPSMGCSIKWREPA